MFCACAVKESGGGGNIVTTANGDGMDEVLAYTFENSNLHFHFQS